MFKKITRNGYKVIIRENSSQINEFKKLQKDLLKYLNVKLYRVENFHYRGNKIHKIAINDLIRQIDTRYGVILDADCIFLYKNWDQILINELNEKVSIIGSQAPVGSWFKKN